MNIAIIGASGMGKFHAREFNSLGCNVIAILGQSKESSTRTANMIKDKFGMIVRPYSSLDNMLKEERISAVSICAPLETHFYFTKKCLEKGLHVFCEKPFTKNVREAEELLSLAKKNGKEVIVNTQWSFLTDKINFKNDIKDLEINMESGLKGKKMLVDHLPHFNSILINLCGVAEIKKLNIMSENSRKIEIVFKYSSSKEINVKFCMSYNPIRPRKIELIINGQRISRVVEKDFSQIITYGKETIKIEDPLRSSIKKFINSIKKKEKNYESYIEIISNLRIQERIVSDFMIK